MNNLNSGHNPVTVFDTTMTGRQTIIPLLKPGENLYVDNGYPDTQEDML